MSNMSSNPIVKHQLKRCVECKTPVPIDSNPSVCDTCNDIRLGKKVMCKCGNQLFHIYRPITMTQQTCVMCMVRGIIPVKTQKQKKIIANYRICTEGCKMPRFLEHTQCDYCNAIHNSTDDYVKLYKTKTSYDTNDKKFIQNVPSKSVIDLSSLVLSELEKKNPKDKSYTKSCENPWTRTKIIQDTSESFYHSFYNSLPESFPQVFHESFIESFPELSSTKEQTLKQKVKQTVKKVVDTERVHSYGISNLTECFTEDIISKLRDSAGATEGQSFVIVFIDPKDKHSPQDVIRSVQ
jgi:hypothetical protein